MRLPPPSAKRRMADWLPRGEANFSWLFKLQDENNSLAESFTISPCTWGHSTPAPTPQGGSGTPVQGGSEPCRRPRDCDSGAQRPPLERLLPLSELIWMRHTPKASFSGSGHFPGAPVQPQECRSVCLSVHLFSVLSAPRRARTAPAPCISTFSSSLRQTEPSWGLESPRPVLSRPAGWGRAPGARPWGCSLWSDPVQPHGRDARSQPPGPSPYEAPSPSLPDP